MIKTKNFNPETDPKLICTCDHKDCDKRSVNQDTLNALQNIRDDFGRSMIITSGGRCPNHPAQARKAEPEKGDHARGDGVDIFVLDRQHYDKIAMLAGRHGFNSIGDGLDRGFIHIGRRKHNGKKISSWGYK